MDLSITVYTKKEILYKWEDLLKNIIKNGLKISPKKYQLLRKEYTICEKYYIY